MHCAEQQLSCHAAAASRMARWPSWHTVPNLNTGNPGSWLSSQQVIISSFRCIRECRHMVSSVLRQVVIAITLTPVWHECHMQFLTSAPNLRGSADPMTWSSWPSASKLQLGLQLGTATASKQTNPQTLHLNEEFCLDTSCRFGLVFTSRWAERVDLVDEDDAGLVFARQIEQIAHQPKRRSPKSYRVETSTERHKSKRFACIRLAAPPYVFVAA